MLNPSKRILLFSSTIVFLLFCYFSTALAGDYLNSAHGENAASAGVNRSGMEVGTGLGYAVGNCAHCHEQHASIEGSEPAPVGGAKNYTLFYDNFVSQTVGVCLRCHVSVGGDQIGNVTNRDYSYRAGNWTAGTPISDMLTQFSFATGAGPTYFPSSHNLSDISTFVQTQAWGYTANSNPCVACHNPHSPQIGAPETVVQPLQPEDELEPTGATGTPLSAASCAGCHGVQGEGVGAFPALAGMDVTQFIELMNQFKTGATPSPMMGTIAQTLSDSDIRELANYYAALNGETQ